MRSLELHTIEDQHRLDELLAGLLRQEAHRFVRCAAGFEEK